MLIRYISLVSYLIYCRLLYNCFFSHGLVGHRKRDNIRDFEHPNVIVYYEVDYVNNAKRTNYWRNRILQAAMDNTDYRFAISSGKEFQVETEHFGHSYVGEIPLVTAHDKDDRRFKMTAKFSLVFHTISVTVNLFLRSHSTFQN